MPKRDRAADVTTDLDGHPVEGKRVRKPADLLVRRCDVASCNTDGFGDTGPNQIWFSDVLLSARDARRAAAWLTRAAEWIDQQEKKP